MRDLRRAHKERMKRKARRLLPDHPKAEYFADHMAACACSMCNRPRYHYKGLDRLTIQERRFESGMRRDDRDPGLTKGDSDVVNTDT